MRPKKPKKQVTRKVRKTTGRPGVKGSGGPGGKGPGKTVVRRPVADKFMHLSASEKNRLRRAAQTQVNAIRLGAHEVAEHMVARQMLETEFIKAFGRKPKSREELEDFWEYGGPMAEA